MIGRAFSLLLAAIVISVSTHAETEMPPEMKKLEYFRQVDQKGDFYAKKLSYAYTYLQSFTAQKYATALLMGGLHRQFAKDLFTDPQLRESMTEWGKIFALGFIADFDGMSEAELVLLSKPKFVQALQGSPQFWKTVTEISKGMKRDIRPAMRRDLNVVALAGNGLFFAASTISIGWMVKAALKLRAIRLIIPGLRARRLATAGLFSAVLLTRDQASAHPDAPAPPTAAEIAAEAAEVTKREIAINRENLRRQFILNEAIKLAQEFKLDLDQDLGKVLPSASWVNTYACDNEQDMQSLLNLKNGLLDYQTRLSQDGLAIKRGDDNLLVRENVGQALQFLLNVIEAKEASGSLQEAC